MFAPNLALVKKDRIIQVEIPPYGSFIHIKGESLSFSLDRTYKAPSLGDHFYYNPNTKHVLLIEHKKSNEFQ